MNASAVFPLGPKGGLVIVPSQRGKSGVRPERKSNTPVLIGITIDDAGGIDACAAGRFERFCHASFTACAFPNNPTAQVNVLGERVNHPRRGWIVVALDTRVAGLVFTHEIAHSWRHR